MLTQFVVAERCDIRRVCRSVYPSRDFDGLDAGEMAPTQLAVLYAVLTGELADASILGKRLGSGGADGPWVHNVPEDLILRLNELDARQLTLAARIWAANWSPDRVDDVFIDLVGICRRAVRLGKPLLMWTKPIPLRETPVQLCRPALPALHRCVDAEKEQ